MIIDCASCVGRPTECGDCVVTVVLGPHPGGLDLDVEERTAMAVLAGSGLVPPLRLMPIVDTESTGDSHSHPHSHPQREPARPRRPRRAG